MIPVCDAHTHVFPQYADLAVRVMDTCGIECCVTLAWHDGFGAGLRRQLDVFGRYPGRFVIFGNIDWTRINEPGFGAAGARQLAADAAAGLRGLKVYKALGLEYRREDGSFWRIDAPEFDPIWARAGELGLPVIMHTADPVYFWQPLNERNFWNGVLYGEYAWWTYYRQGFPSPDELLGERNAVIARHPGTTFVCPHLGSKAHALESAAEDLDTLPNLYYDISARIPIMGRSPRRATRAREFILEYQDRILFGTDMIYDDINVPTGMQAQCLYQPGEVPLNGADPRERYAETSAAFFQAHMDFLLSDALQTDPPFKRAREGIGIHGLGLGEDVVRKLVWENPRRLLLRDG